MKTIFKRISILGIVFLFALSCTDPSMPSCRISKFYWEDEWHDAHYNSDGRLRALIAVNSQVYFYYDASSRLTSAEIFTGDPTPFYKYEFIHGPDGIIQTDEYHPSALGTEHTRTIFHYATPTRIDYIIHQEFGYTEEIGFEIREDISYTSNNVKFIDGTSSVITTEYLAGKYDKKKNPFRALAAAVGNNAFFPVCRVANFPVSDYDISKMNIFSVNNPLRASYRLPGVDPTSQLFTYTYHGGIAKTIKWAETSYGTTTTEEYAFEFECGHRKSSEE
jgi:hypothetical protein